MSAFCSGELKTLQSKFQTCITFAVFLVIDQNFDNMFEFACHYFCNSSHNSVKNILRYRELNFILKYFLSLWSCGQEFSTPIQTKGPWAMWFTSKTIPINKHICAKLHVCLMNRKKSQSPFWKLNGSLFEQNWVYLEKVLPSLVKIGQVSNFAERDF